MAVSTVLVASSSLALAAAGPVTRLQFTQFVEDRPTPVVDAAVHVVPCAPINATCRDLLNDLAVPFRGSKVWTGASMSQALTKAEGQLLVQKGHRLLRTDAAGSARLSCPTANCLVFAASTAAGRTVVWSFLQPLGRSRELLPSDGLSLVADAPAAELGSRELRWIAAATLATPLLLLVLLLVVLLERRQMRRRFEELLSTLREEARFEIATLNVAVEAIRSILAAIELEQGGVHGPAVPFEIHGPEGDSSDHSQPDHFQSDQQQTESESLVSPQDPGDSPTIVVREVNTLIELDQGGVHGPAVPFEINRAEGDIFDHFQSHHLKSDQQQTASEAIVSPQGPGDFPNVVEEEITTLQELELAAIEARSLRLALDQSAALLQEALDILPEAEQVADRLKIALEEASSFMPILEIRLMELRAARRSDPPASIEPIPPAALELPLVNDPPRSDRAAAPKGTRLGQVLPIVPPDPISPTDPPPA
ncbi:MAG: hypothetical protein WBM08_11020 [Prochlorococcaceae cyanobacterium]